VRRCHHGEVFDIPVPRVGGISGTRPLGGAASI
jgi:hypothetical protein